MKRALMAAVVLPVLIGLASPPPASAGTLAGVTLADSVRSGDQTLVLNGLGLRSKFMVKVYVAGLYLPAREKDPAKVLAADGERRMVMHFVRSVGADKICEGWEEGLVANTPGASAELEQQFATLCSWMEATQAGTEVVLAYSPATGTRIEVGGRSKGTIPGKAFADAVLACWIGPKPGPGEDFKKGILGG